MGYGVNWFIGRGFGLGAFPRGGAKDAAPKGYGFKLRWVWVD
jgi:hypothetical protein